MVACEAEQPAPESPEEGLALELVDFDTLPGWEADNLDGVMQAFGRSCQRLLRLDPQQNVGSSAIISVAGDWRDVCTELTSTDPGISAATLRAFFEARFEPFLVRDLAGGPSPNAAGGLFTGYFEAELNGSRTPDETYASPLYARPHDLVQVDLGRFDPELAGKGIVGQIEDGRLVPYRDRGEIESGALAHQGLELLWIDDPVDVFLLQVQGSGRVNLPGGEVVRVGFAAHNGHDYRSIGRKLIDDGELEVHEASWSGIRRWIGANPDKATELFAHNPRFVFFRLLKGNGPVGAEGVALTPRRSLAVDTRYIPLGVPLWLDTTRPGTGDEPLQRLMVAQDKGGAIKGVVRGDFFWGYGGAALAEAGRMKSTGRYFLLLPKPLVDRFKAAS